MTNCYAPGDRDDYMSVKKSVKKSKYERKMRKRNPEWGKNKPIQSNTPGLTGIEYRRWKPGEYKDLVAPVQSIPAHIRPFIRSIVE